MPSEKNKISLKELKETRELKITFPKPNSIFVIEKNRLFLDFLGVRK